MKRGCRFVGGSTTCRSAEPLPVLSRAAESARTGERRKNRGSTALSRACQLFCFALGSGALLLLPACGGTTASTPDDKPGSGGSNSVGGKASSGGPAMAGDSGAPVGGTSDGGDGSAAAGAAAGGPSGAGAGPTIACSTPEDDLDACNPGPDQICRDGMCMDGLIWGEQAQGMQTGDLGRGSGVLCWPVSIGGRHPFACMAGEWCLANELCRCGNHPGCQVGEQCAPACEGEGCEDPNDYHCVRAVGCAEDNLDRCAAEPGQLCMSAADECSTAEACTADQGGAEQIACGEDADAQCCPSGHWCFNQEQCRCGTGPACHEAETCTLNDIGFYECLPS
jgi:hypothetical protein